MPEMSDNQPGLGAGGAGSEGEVIPAATADRWSLTRPLVAAASVVIIVVGMRTGAAILAPALLGFVLAISVVPLIGWLQARGIPSWLAFSIVALSVVFVGLLAIGVLLSSVNGFRAKLPAYQAALEDRGTAIDTWLTAAGVDLPELRTWAKADVATLARAGAGFLSKLVSSLYSLGLVLFMAVLFLLGAQGLSSRLWARPTSDSASLAGFLEFSRGVQQNTLGLTLNNLATATLITVWLMLFRVDFVLLWGLLAFFLGYIPNVGMLLAAVPPVLLVFVQYGPETALVVAVGLIVVIEVLNFVTNALIGEAVDISPAASFVAFLFWAWVFGPLGTLLAYPLTVAVKIALERHEETRWLAAAMSSKPAGPKNPVPPGR